MLKKVSSVFSNKSSLFLLTLALIVVGVGAQATGLLNTKSGGYLVCVNSATKVVTHPGTSSCPKGSKKLILGAQGVAGADGITGAAGIAGIAGKDGTNGKDGNTLWNGVKDPESTLGAPGDMFINSLTKTLFGPKDLTTGWPAGVSMVGPAGATGPQGPGGGGPAGPAGSNATIAITELFVCDGPDAGTVADEKCKIGMTGPGDGIIFFVDYNNEHVAFNYLEVAPVVCEDARDWSLDVLLSTFGAAPADAMPSRALGVGKANTTAMKLLFPLETAVDNAAWFATGCAAGGQTDWFLGSLGEMKLIYDNLQGLGEFQPVNFWSSSEGGFDGATPMEWSFDFMNGSTVWTLRTDSLPIRPIRAF